MVKSYLKPRRSRANRVKARICVQDPLFAEESRYGVAEIKLMEEPWLGAGPTSSRLKVIDEEMWRVVDDDYVAVDKDDRTRKYYSAAEVLSKGGGFSTGRKQMRENFKFHQVNVWAIISKVLEHIESGEVFGRRIPWAFPNGRLAIYPHAVETDNAFYERDGKGGGHLAFGYYTNKKKGKPVYICLSHDIVVHELGHAVLDGLKPLYWEAVSPECKGFHEFFGDALAMTSALTMREVIVPVVGKAPKKLGGSNLISDVAREFGSTYEGSTDACLRSANNRKTMGDVRGGFEEYEYSQVLSGAFYDILREIYSREYKLQKKRNQKRKKENKKPYGSGYLAVTALFKAASYTSRLMLRGVDYCPPAGLTFVDYARAVIRADTVAYPVDDRGYRKIVSKVFEDREIATAKQQNVALLQNNQLWPYDVNIIASGPTDAYAFLDQNREVLGIGRDVEIEFCRVFRTNKTSAAGYNPPKEIILEFAWKKDIQLSGPKFGDYDGEVLSLWCGGTLVFDTNNNILHYVLADDIEQRLQGYLRYLIHNELIEGEDTGASAKIQAKIVDGKLILETNGQKRHQRRKNNA